MTMTITKETRMNDKSQKQIREFYEVNAFALQLQEMNKSGMYTKKQIKSHVLSNIDTYLDTESESK